MRKAVPWLIAGYLVFWVGGTWSFGYTHRCARAHTEERLDSQGNDRTTTVCDYYVANGKRWTILDPVRATRDELFDTWADTAIVLGLAAFIGGAVWRVRRKDRVVNEWNPLKDL